ncbi:cytochrome c oxidase subunit II [Arenimonas sp. MALMAid1274]|uniref:cytochrome c oxidase subunit II n=1 Tax=Arenimonas sp. MALMAid1274 TaxID=3411630 RepID=UPI003BA163CD
MKANAMVARVAAGLLAATASASAWADSEPVRWQLNMPEGVTRTAENAYDMHMLMLWICVAIGLVVFGAMGYSMYKFRHSKGAKPDVDFTHSTKLEIIWTVVPVLILVIMAVPATARLMEQYDTKGSDMTVKVTGYQWMWRYEIVGEDVNFISRLDRESDRIRQSGETPTAEANPHYLRDVDRVLVLPTETKIRFVITSDDVIHAWWVPALGWKQDAIPGVINDAWTEIRTPGTYRGVCAELCGKDHGFMPIVVKAVPRAEYEAWLTAQKAGDLAEADRIAATSVVPAKAGGEG